MEKQETDNPLRLVNPQQNVFYFDEIVIRSDFDNGNIGRAERVDKRNVPFYSLNVSADLLQFHLWVSPDGAPYQKEGGYTTWFHFGVQGVPYHETVTFTIRNMNN